MLRALLISGSEDMELIEAITLCVDESRILCGGHEDGCPRCEAADMVIKAFGIDDSMLTPITAEHTPAASLSNYRKKLEPHLVHLIAGLRHHQVKEAVALLLDYIDTKSQTMPTSTGMKSKDQ
ncbi:hypothetical protein HNP33_004177 [Comamonas odontotermitis]|uniref:Uncharacterized protein n=1 Tax=Comamonas odontotermitis TaxID=379895 RepID=A0ABR6RLM0_9BURK|nr:hypothetical protein [Comamonas odontotermitis]MBB6580051.1 hypothetical protein [Comamonas odontotermitis]